jgi:hypothetical protein
LVNLAAPNKQVKIESGGNRKSAAVLQRCNDAVTAELQNRSTSAQSLFTFSAMRFLLAPLAP